MLLSFALFGQHACPLQAARQKALQALQAALLLPSEPDKLHRQRLVIADDNMYYRQVEVLGIMGAVPLCNHQGLHLVMAVLPVTGPCAGRPLHCPSQSCPPIASLQLDSGRVAALQEYAAGVRTAGAPAPGSAGGAVSTVRG